MKTIKDIQQKLEARELLYKVLNYLIDEKNYCIKANDINRYAWNDGFYSKEYKLCDEKNNTLYLTHFFLSTKEMEPKLASDNVQIVKPTDILFNSDYDNYSDDVDATPKNIITYILMNKRVCADIPEDMIIELKKFKNIKIK